MSFLNHLKQRQAAQQAESNDAGIRKPRIPARLLLQSNTYASPVAGPLTAPYPQHHQQNQVGKCSEIFDGGWSKRVGQTWIEKNEAKTGDRVRVVECRPLSKLKCWRLVEVLKH